MKTHTSKFKEKIKEFGRELDSKITYTIDGTTTELGNEQLNSVTPHYEGAILKSVMKQLDIDSNVEIPVGTLLNYQFGVKTRTGKNLLNRNNLQNGYQTTYTLIDTGFNANGKWYVSYPFNVSNGTYTMNADVVVNSGTSTSWTGKVRLAYSDSTYSDLYSFPHTFNITKEVDSVLFYTSNGTTTTDVDFKDAMIEENPIATSYEDYGAYDYVNYGNYIVKDIEKQEDTRSYKITCYDKMLYSMTDYEDLEITYPITIRSYINAICNHLGITFANSSDTFANYNREITSEKYLSYDNETETYSSLGYKFRDVLDELAEVTASTICINDDDELEIRYINQTIGKNLWQNSDYYTQLTSDNLTIENNGFSFIRNGLNYGRYVAKKIAVENGKTYTFSATSNDFGTNDFYLVIYRGNVYGTNLKSTLASYLSYTSTADEELYFTFIIGSALQSASVSNIQVEINDTKTDYEPYGDTIDEEYLKDVNVNFGEKFGAVNTIVLTRSAESDSIYYPTTPPADPIEIRIEDNQIMNGNDRDTYMPDIYAKLNGLEYCINDFSSVGICYYDLCDKYNIKVGDNFYSCIMFNDEVNITQGLEEQVYTEMPEDTNPDYSKADTTDRKINTAYVLADKANSKVDIVTSQYSSLDNRLDTVETKQTATDLTIDVISQNVTYEYDQQGNPVSSKINEVTTTTGFTFNAEGLTISDSNTNFSALHRNDGTYYKDGDTIVGEYTKDGSKQKDLHLFGVYYYGMKNKDETPMFVAQLYTDNNGDEAFGHFYNGGN